MLLTEKQAAERWCPFIQISCSGGYTVDNRASNDTRVPDAERRNCLGSRCAAWRWADLRDAVGPEAQHPHDWDDLKMFHPEDTKRRFIRRGHCGMAGKPVTD